MVEESHKIGGSPTSFQGSLRSREPRCQLTTPLPPSITPPPVLPFSSSLVLGSRKVSLLAREMVRDPNTILSLSFLPLLHLFVDMLEVGRMSRWPKPEPIPCPKPITLHSLVLQVNGVNSSSDLHWHTESIPAKHGRNIVLSYRICPRRGNRTQGFAFVRTSIRFDSSRVFWSRLGLGLHNMSSFWWRVTSGSLDPK